MQYLLRIIVAVLVISLSSCGIQNSLSSYSDDGAYYTPSGGQQQNEKDHEPQAGQSAAETVQQGAVNPTYSSGGVITEDYDDSFTRSYPEGYFLSTPASVNTNPTISANSLVPEQNAVNINYNFYNYGYSQPFRSYRYGYAYDPYFYDPFYYDPFYYNPFYRHHYRPYAYRPFRSYKNRGGFYWHYSSGYHRYYAYDPWCPYSGRYHYSGWYPHRGYTSIGWHTSGTAWSGTGSGTSEQTETNQQPRTTGSTNLMRGGDPEDRPARSNFALPEEHSEKAQENSRERVREDRSTSSERFRSQTMDQYRSSSRESGQEAARENIRSERNANSRPSVESRSENRTFTPEPAERSAPARLSSPDRTTQPMPSRETERPERRGPSNFSPSPSNASPGSNRSINRSSSSNSDRQPTTRSSSGNDREDVRENRRR